MQLDSEIEDVLWDEVEQRKIEDDIAAVMRGDKATELRFEKEELYPSEFVEFAVKLSIAGGIRSFSFDNRPYLKSIYNSSARRMLLKCGRQTEKCDCKDEKVLTPSGKWTTVGDMKVGDKIVSLESLDTDAERDGLEVGQTRRLSTSWRLCRDTVVAKSCIGEEDTVKITTRMGSEMVVSSATPILLSAGWMRADEIEVGARVAVARGLGEAAEFGSGSHGEVVSELYGILIADGGLRNRNPTITKFDKSEFDHIVGLLDRAGNPHTLYPPPAEKKPYIRLRVGPVVDLLTADGLIGRVSGNKFVPDWVFEDATREETIAFIKGLWRCDGSVKRRNRTLWDIVYASTSKRLAQQVRELLLKFGIPSRFRANDHIAYRDDPDKDQYLVRVETIEGVRLFLDTFGEGAPSDLAEFGDSNRDTYPIELVGPLIKNVCAELGLGLRQGRGRVSVMKERGLRVSLKYPLSRAKLHRYLQLFDDMGAEGVEEYDQLRAIFHGDVIWDQVVQVEELGPQEVYHIEVERNHNYLHAGLVTHNSTMLGNLCLAYSALNPAFKTLYVSATAQQAQVFSVDRIKEPIETSPVLQALTNNALSQNVFFKQFTNRSQIRLRYAFLSADRVRGIPADKILIDEIQDILTENIPVIEECASHSEWKLMRYSGTPKSLDNTIEVYWQQFSTQNEWMVPCDGCNTWNQLGENNIGGSGVICARCGRSINVRHEKATWAAANPITLDNGERVAFEGYRIPQIMVPWVTDDKDGWADIKLKQKQYSRSKFSNEVLGLSYDSGTRPLKRNHVESCCIPTLRMADFDENVAKCGNTTFMGLDWGSGERASFTVVTIGGYMNGVFTIIFAHRFTGSELEPPVQLDIIAQLVHKARVYLVGADYGGGFDRNDFMTRSFGQQKIWKFQYAARPNQKLVWQPKLGRFIVHRTEVMSDVFNAIKRHQMRFPRWPEFVSPHAEDMLNIFSEKNELINMTQYKVSPGKSDDTFHSILYCFLASMLVRPRIDILIPSKADDIVMPM